MLLFKRALSETKNYAIAYIDRINALHKSELCYDFVNREIQAQCPPRKTAGDPESMLIPSFVAEQFGIWFVVFALGTIRLKITRLQLAYTMHTC